MKILIVDDETPIREWIQFCIERAQSPKLQITGLARNGKEAYEIFEREKPEVVISDIKMPVMDGIALMKKIFAEKPETIFLILTNHAEFTYAQEAIEFGARRYFLKSELRGEELIKELETIVETEEKRGVVQLVEKEKSNAEERQKSEKSEEGEALYSQVIQDVITYLENHYQEDISLVDVARQVYRSSEYLSRRFKLETGENFSIFLMMYRMKKARELLQTTDMKIYQIAHQVGYQTPGYFTRIYRKYMGENPEDTRSQYRNRKSK